ncbi:hypothetical protein tpqmel_0823 [Candidatus Gastranaerophilus sp. (ex Termes propinquus)]|nr:hypothetical protein tpqmel_0823 [Candidatus Gastranaerophilus sp. (ex Termes propinquus)]
MGKIDTFSVHSLKLLEKDPEEFKRRYVDCTHFTQNPVAARAGKKFHLLISYHLKGLDTAKFENALSEPERALWCGLKNDPIFKNDFKLVEHTFLIKEDSFSSP